MKKIEVLTPPDDWIQTRLTKEAKISVIVAVYNISTYLIKCVESIKKQTFPYLEIVLVDDGSTDNSGELCEELAKYDARIVVIHKENGGLSDARNAGIEAASGDYIAFVDGDDWIEPDMYERLLYALLSQNAEVAICRYRCIYKDGSYDNSTNACFVFNRQEVLYAYLSEDETYAIQNAAWNKLYRKDFLGEQRFPKGKWYEDIVYTTKLLARTTSCVYVDKAGYNYVMQREGSIMNAGTNPRILSDQIPAYMEKTAYLYQIGEPELAQIHESYVCKRLLLFYLQFRTDKTAAGKQAVEQIVAYLEPFRGRADTLYNWNGAEQRDQKKLALFFKSPKLYTLAILFNDKIRIPLKERLRG